MAEFIAAGLEADGAPEAAQAVRLRSDVIEEFLETLGSATVCAGSTAKAMLGGAAAGGAVAGPLGALVGAAGGLFANLFNPSCHSAVRNGMEYVEAVERIAETAEAACPSGSVPMADTASCDEHCDAQISGWCAHPQPRCSALCCGRCPPCQP